jgi:hypothetical protein
MYWNVIEKCQLKKDIEVFPGGDMQELGELEDSELIDRKVIKRDTDAALMLDPEMTLTEEVKEYLTYILELPEETVESVIKEMQNYAEKIEAY